MAISFSTVTLLAAVMVFIHLLWKAASQSRNKLFPKGPPTLPLLGNVHQIPQAKAFLTFTSWARNPSTSSTDGLVGLRLGPNAHAVVLNKWWHIRDLFDSRDKGAVYSDRPYNAASDHVLPGPGRSELHLAFARYGPQWRRARRTMVEFLTEKEVEKLTHIQDAESSQMVWELLQNCGADQATQHGVTDYHRYVLRYFNAVILASAFGQRGKDSHPQSKVMEFYAVEDDWAAILELGGSPPFDVFPWLKYVPDFVSPWRGWTKKAADLQKRQNSFYHGLISETEGRLQAGKSEECFMARILKGQQAAVQAGKTKDVYTRQELDYIGGFFLEAGADTTAITFETFLLAMIAYPEAQKEAQREIDEVFGPDEMPHTNDGTKLPYVKACFLETLRWRCPMPTAIPHANTADDVYQGCFIPKGTMMIPNVWAITHDPDEFEDPETYNPSRYMANRFGTKPRAGLSPSAVNNQELGEGLDTAALNPGSEVSTQGRRQTYAFGAGRRVCAGSKMAENSMMFTMAKVLWSFDIVYAGDRATGPDLDIRRAFKDSILAGPKEFPAVFRLRDERKRDVIRREWEGADKMLSRFE